MSDFETVSNFTVTKDDEKGDYKIRIETTRYVNFMFSRADLVVLGSNSLTDDEKIKHLVDTYDFDTRLAQGLYSDYRILIHRFGIAKRNKPVT